MEKPVSPDRSTSSPLVYGLEERVPIGPALLVSAQQVAAMVVGTITPPLILAGILKWPAADTAYLVSMALLASALGTLLQTLRLGPVGSGLLSVTGTSFSFLQPLILAGQMGGLALMLGMSLVTAPVQLVLAPFLPKLRKVFTPLVSGVVVLLIGLSLIPSAMYGIVTPAAIGAPSWAGALVAGIVIAVVLGAQAAGRRWTRLASVLFGVAAGYLVCAAGGWLHAPEAGDGSWVTLPRWLPHGFSFSWALVLPFAFIYLVSVLEAMGDMTATAELSALPTDGSAHWMRLRGGVLADGLTSLTSALVGGFPSTTYAQNNGVIQITGVASRRIGPLMAVMLALLGLFPAVGRWVTAMPPAVLGALALMLFGLVAVSGLRLIASRGISQREALIVALSLAIGLGAPSQPSWLGTLPEWVKAFLESGIAAGGITALVLSLVLPGGRTLPGADKP
ncbi:uracil-xanthine permease [bacterium]|nr:uracil-xanthine permease [bacterium]